MLRFPKLPSAECSPGGAEDPVLGIQRKGDWELKRRRPRAASHRRPGSDGRSTCPWPAPGRRLDLPRLQEAREVSKPAPRLPSIRTAALAVSGDLVEALDPVPSPHRVSRSRSHRRAQGQHVRRRRGRATPTARASQQLLHHVHGGDQLLVAHLLAQAFNLARGRWRPVSPASRFLPASKNSFDQL